MGRNTGLIIVVVVALLVVFFIGAYLLMGDFSNSKEKEDYVKSQPSSIEQELSNLRATNFELAMQLSQAQSQINSLKNQNQFQDIQIPATNDRKCNNLDDDYDNTKDDIRDKKNEISDLKDEIARRTANNETTTFLEEQLDELNHDLDDLENDLDDIKDDLDRYDC